MVFDFKVLVTVYLHSGYCLPKEMKYVNVNEYCEVLGVDRRHADFAEEEGKDIRI